MKSILTGFKDFILRGNVIDLAVGIIIGAAFTAIVTGLVDGILNPLIAAIFGSPDISEIWNISLRGDDEGAVLHVGQVLQAILNFLIVAAALYFAIVLPMNHLAKLRKSGEEPEPEAPAEDVLLLQEIRDLLAAQTGRGTPNTAPGQGTTPGV